MKKLVLVGVSILALAGCGNSYAGSSSQRAFTGTDSVYTYGIDNDVSDLKVIENALGTQNYVDGTNKFAIDVQTLVENNIPVESTSNIYSSAKVTKAPKGYGIQVTVKTPQNITLVTPYQYQSAVIDLGVSDVRVDIASSRSATGEGALAGVIFSLKRLGTQVSVARANLAQKGLDTLAQVAEENPNVNQEQLANAVNEVKSELLQANNSNLSNAQITQIVQNVVNNNNINITDNSVNNIVNYFTEFNSNSEVMNDPAVRENVAEVKELGVKSYEALQSKFNEFTNYLNSAEGQEQIGGILDSIGNFLSDVGRGISDFLNSIFN